MTIDSFVWGALFMATVFLVATVTGQVQSTSSGADADLEGTGAAVAFVLWLGASVGYHTVLEWRYGKTLGKHLVSIRVTGEDGSRPSLQASLIRNVTRLVDWLPAFYVLGIAALVLSTEPKRLGDRFGRTTVVR